ncbi:phosphate acyltransferase [bacterium BMS3Abin05]|nr:phosphate acyltransferase [bacterium BMS3Abin05]GBE27106.1 phosphate acyltransferase [bacterium BMS3Bbin03]HDZ11437.1 phosphate acyltransferase PlsX [Bacteroidota bacterium]
MKIAVDAMGGDYAPGAIVEGAVQAARVAKGRYGIVLVGDELKIKKELEGLNASNLTGIEIVHASEIIDMHDSPTDAIKKKKDASMVVAARLQKEGEVQAVVSAGNTGAFMAASLFSLGRLRGVKRPGLGSFIPNEKGMSVVIDVGANSDCKSLHLLQFGIMGSLYVRHIFDTENPRVGLLSNGEEESKGNALTKEAHKLLKSSRLNFIGNVEGRDILKGTAEVIVCDGFVGNIVLKFAESIVGMLKNTIKKSIGKNILSNLGAILMRPAFHQLSKLMDYQEYGGVPLLGVNGVSIVCHGSSSPKAIRNAIREAEKMNNRNVNRLIEVEIEKNPGV